MVLLSLQGEHQQFVYIPFATIPTTAPLLFPSVCLWFVKLFGITVSVGSESLRSRESMLDQLKGKLRRKGNVPITVVLSCLCHCPSSSA